MVEILKSRMELAAVTSLARLNDLCAGSFDSCATAELKSKHGPELEARARDALSISAATRTRSLLPCIQIDPGLCPGGGRAACLA